MKYLWSGMIVLGVLFAAVTGNLKEVTEAVVDSSKEAVALCVSMAGITAVWVGLMKIGENAGLITWLSEKVNPLLSFLFPNLPQKSAARHYLAVNMLSNVLGLGWAATPAGLKAMEELEKVEEERRRKKGRVGQKAETEEGSKARQKIHMERETGIEGQSRAEAKSKTKPKVRLEQKIKMEGHNQAEEGNIVEPRAENGQRFKAEEGGGWKEDREPVPRGTASNEMCTFLIINVSSLQLIPINMIAYRSQYGSVDPAAIVGPAVAATLVSTLTGIFYCRRKDRKVRGRT